MGIFPPNELGLCDMTGNVWEWCADWYDAYSGGAADNLKGPSPGSFRVIRGGSWYDVPRFVRCAYRYINTPDSRNDSVGFRLAGPR